MKTRLDINNFVQHTTVLSCSQFTRCIHLSKRKAKINKKNSGRSFCVSKKICVLQVYFTSKSWRQIWWCVKYLLSILFISVFIIKPKVWGEQCYACVSVFYHIDLEQDLFFLALFKPIILSFSQFCKTNCVHSISRTIEARASFEQKIIELFTL